MVNDFIGKANHHKDYTINLGEKYDVVIKQTIEDDKKIYTLNINKEIIEIVENQQAKSFVTVDLYISDNYYDTFGKYGKFLSMNIINLNPDFLGKPFIHIQIINIRLISCRLQKCPKNNNCVGWK